MTVEIPSKYRRYLERKVKEGPFRSADEVVVEALALLKNEDAHLAELRKKLKEACDEIDRGEDTPWDVEDVKRRLLERLARRKGRK